MATQTDISLRNQLIYSVFVRNHTEEGTLAALELDLPRIRALGTDIVWLMPIHPIGLKARKGKLGSPYAIRDYRSVNPEIGTLKDFENLTTSIHRLGMKCMIDVVYNHTSPDSVLAQEHPEWFYQDVNGKPCNRVADWTDVVDLDYSQRDLWAYQIETLKQWAEYVDGFRCDVAPLLPLEFWKEARTAVASIKPDMLWLAESVEPGFILDLRRRGLNCSSDAELYQAFDILYSYDIKDEFLAAASQKGALPNYVKSLERQEAQFPLNYNKLRYLENHDNLRAAHLFRDKKQLRNWTAFTYILRGTTLIYGGQEYAAQKTPSLFDLDPIRMAGEKLSPLMAKLAEIKHDCIDAEAVFLPRVDHTGKNVIITYRGEERSLVAVFCLQENANLVRVDLPDGEYRNLLNDQMLKISGRLLLTRGEPAVFWVD